MKLDFDQLPSPREMLDVVETELMERLLYCFIAVEALGSIAAAEKAGLLEMLPHPGKQTLRDMIPASRGGWERGVEAEHKWQRVVDSMLAKYGDDVLDRARAAIESDLAAQAAAAGK